MNVIVTRENGVATVTLNRPDKLNALSAEMYHELADAFTALGADDEARSVIVIGAGRAFCAGGDVSSMGGMGASEIAAGRKRTQSHQRMIKSLHNLEKPVIAAGRFS